MLVSNPGVMQQLERRGSVHVLRPAEPTEETARARPRLATDVSVGSGLDGDADFSPSARCGALVAFLIALATSNTAHVKVNWVFGSSHV